MKDKDDHFSSAIYIFALFKRENRAFNRTWYCPSLTETHKIFTDDVNQIHPKLGECFRYSYFIPFLCVADVLIKYMDTSSTSPASFQKD